MKNKKESWEKEFDEKFPGLKSIGHKKIHYLNHDNHNGEKCIKKCCYVGEAIKSFIRNLLIKDSHYQVCEGCGKRDETVSTRSCGYAEDVYNNPNCMETVCDACEHEHCMDI